MNEPRRHLPVLTQSSLTTFRRCPREYHFAYRLNRKSFGTTAALTFGLMWHAGLEAWWANADQRFVYASNEMALFAIEHLVDEYELVKAQCLMAGYTARWGDEPYETIAVEKNFAVPIIIPGSRAPSYELRGSIDAIVLERRSLHNVESKTTSSDISIGSDYWRRVIALDAQVSTYSDASKQMGFDIRDTIYDVTRKPELVPLKATPEESKKYTKPTKSEPVPRLYSNQRETDETPDEYRTRLTEDIIARPDWYFARQTIVRLDHDDAEHAKDVTGTAQMIRHAEAFDLWPRSPNACERFRQLCSFFPVCSGETTIDDDARYETKTAQHEELI